MNFGYVWPSNINSFYIQNYTTLCLYVLRFNVPVNNFSVMSGQIHDSRLASDLSVGHPEYRFSCDDAHLTTVNSG